MIIQNITLDLSQKSPYQYLYTKQGDDQSRYVCVRLTHEGETFCPEGVTANLRARKPDGTMVLDPATVNEDGTITLELTQQLLAVSGPVLADVCLIGSRGEILSTVSFVIHVDAAPSGEKMDSTSEFLTLMELVGRVEGSLTTDRTLSISDRAADAKATGDALAEQQGLVDSVSGSLRAVEADLAVERERINQLIRLDEGSTTGDAELQDIRVGWDGTVHSSAGNAVRAVGSLAGALPQFRYLEDSEAYNRLTVNLVEEGFYSITASLWDDLPCGHCALLVLRYATNYVVQLAVAQSDGKIYSRVVNRTDCSIYKDWMCGMEALQQQVDALPQFRYLADSDAYNRLTANLVEEGFYSITASLWDDLPCGHCALLVFRYATNYVLQVAFAQSGGLVYCRIINRETRQIYSDWRGALEWNGYKIPVTTPVLDSAAYNRLAARVTTPGYYNIIASEWDDIPFSHCAMWVFQHSANYVVQIAVSTGNGGVRTRVVQRSTYAIHRDWTSPDGIQPVKVLCVGDSIARGYRNSGKGFVGDLGVKYKNAAVSSASLSNVKAATATTIPDQLVNVTGYDPDVIVADGGVNDYAFNAPLGIVPTTAVTTDAAAEALNRNTVMGGIEYLFYKMITLYPKAQRFFLLTHKTTGRANGAVTDWTVTENTQGYTQTDLFEAIKKVCAVYGVKVIDVFGESMINTAFDVYKSEIAYSDDNSVTDTEFVDADGVHPLSYGYLHGYIPLVKQALLIGTRK